MEIKGKKDQVLLKDKTIKEPVVVKECVNCTIENVEFRYDRSDTTLLTLSNCQKVKVLNCRFSDKSTLGLFLKLNGAATKDNIIEGCEMWNHTFSAANGGEVMRIGNSDVSGCNYNTVVRKNLFHDNRSDPEVISIKSCGNIIEENQFENNKGMVVVRHGGYNIIRNNKFRGTGGIRILGAGNKVTGNYFKDNPDSVKWIPVAIEYGNTERDPNFTPDNKPTGKQGKSHATYAQPTNNEIVGNRYENCKSTFETRQKGRKFGPINNKIDDNIEVKPAQTAPTEPEDPPEPQDPEEDKPITGEGDETEPLPPNPTTEDLIARFEKLSETINQIKTFIDTVLSKLKENQAVSSSQ